MTSQVVDTPTAEEFMREALERVSEADLFAIATELEGKSAEFRAQLVGGPPAAGELRAVLRHVFAARRHADAMIEEIGAERLGAEVDRLLHGADALPTRVERFHQILAPFPGPAFELGSELLHFTYPDDYWLWARWMWDARTETGALRLVTVDEFDFDAPDFGHAYLKVGEATAFVHETGRAVGFTAFGEGLFGIDVFLACVYAVYMYTVLRLRMTQEFNRIVPELPDLVRRLLGVYRPGPSATGATS